MIAISKPSRETVCAEDQQNEQFLNLVPAIRRYALLAFRHLRPQDRDEALGEVLAHAFCAFRRLVELDRLDVAYATPLARFGVARCRSRRPVGSKLNSGDVYAARGCRRGRCSADSVEASINRNVFVEMLADNTATPVIDQVAFRLDFRAWLRMLKQRDRKLVKYMAMGNSAGEAAERFAISTARVSQLRGELQASWTAFQGEVT
jgi:hypothetical protein